jgi:ribosomal protein L29
MLNRIVIINSELYAKAAIHIGDNASIQITAENNVGKSSFLNTLNFLYITDKDQMRFEDNRRLSDSMKHYFDGTSLHSFIIFEIFKNGYYCILVKATPENTIEYYKISGEYKEIFFIQTSAAGFKSKRWENILQELTNDNPTDPPTLLKSEELYNLVYNSDKNKNPVVWIKREVKRKGRALSNSFTDIYKHLIKTSEINEKSFKNALLIADNKQDTLLNVFTSSSFDKINEFEKKKTHLDDLRAVTSDFEKLKLLNDNFIAEEKVLGKLKNTFFKKFDAVEKDLSDKTASDSLLSISIRTLETKIDVTLKKERDDLITKKANFNTQIKTAEEANREIDKHLKEVEDYEPQDNHLMFQGLITKAETEDQQRIQLEAQLTQLERSKFTLVEVERAIKKLDEEIKSEESSIKEFDNLLYQNISPDPEIIRKAYSLLSSKVAKLDKSKIKKEISKADFPFTFFDGKIDASEIEIKKLPTIKELQDDVETKKKELAEKKIQLDAITNQNTLQGNVESLKKSIAATNTLIGKVQNKPVLIKTKADNETLINVTLKKSVTDTQIKIGDKDNEIEKEKEFLKIKKDEKKQYEDDLKKYRNHYQNFQDRQDIYEIEEILDESFEKLYEKFSKTYNAFAGVEGTRERRKDLKDSINLKLKKDIQDIKQFIREVEEEISNIPQMDKVISNLLDTLSYEIGSPTFSFLTAFNDFKTFVYKSYNSKLAEYPVSNIQSVKVKIYETEELIKDLDRISKLKFSNGLDFDNTYSESKKALERQLTESKGKPIEIYDLFTIKVEITKATGESEEIDLSKQVQSRGTNIVLKLYLFLNILKDLIQSANENKVVIYVDELDAIGQKNVKHLIQFCKDNNFIPIFAAPRKVEGIQKYYMIKEPLNKNKNQKPKITFGELQSFPVVYRNAE